MSLSKIGEKFANSLISVDDISREEGDASAIYYLEGMPAGTLPLTFVLFLHSLDTQE